MCFRWLADWIAQIPTTPPRLCFMPQGEVRLGQKADGRFQFPLRREYRREERETGLVRREARCSRSADRCSRRAVGRRAWQGKIRAGDGRPGRGVPMIHASFMEIAASATCEGRAASDFLNPARQQCNASRKRKDGERGRGPPMRAPQATPHKQPRLQARGRRSRQAPSPIVTKRGVFVRMINVREASGTMYRTSAVDAEPEAGSLNPSIGGRGTNR
jgi:hypothetical protein